MRIGIISFYGIADFLNFARRGDNCFSFQNGTDLILCQGVSLYGKRSLNGADFIRRARILRSLLRGWRLCTLRGVAATFPNTDPLIFWLLSLSKYAPGVFIDTTES